MKTNVEQLNPTRVKLNIAITPEEFKPSIDEAYKHLGAQIQIPGFRKGKVPAAIIDQRLGRGAVIEHAVNDHLDTFYQQAIAENKIRPLGQPSADVEELPDIKTLEGDLVINVEVDVRPEITLPELSKLTVTVDAVEVSVDDVQDHLDKLRERFGTLITVDRPAASGDFTSIDLIATLDGTEIDNATNISYQIGSGQLVDGIDEALETLTAGETTSFESTLLGGDHEGETATIEVTLKAVKERELPEADDDFAQLASEFDTIGELRESLKKEVADSKKVEQSVAARDAILEELQSQVEVPIPEGLIDAEVARHLESEGKAADDPHAEEVRPEAEKAFRTQLLLDEVAETNEVSPDENEITEYAIQSAIRYNMEPGEFLKIMSEQGQIPALVAEVTRRKAITLLLGKATVKDSKGKKVDMSEFTKSSAELAAEAAAEAEAE